MLVSKAWFACVWLLALSSALFVRPARAAVSGDEITSLPGWSGKLPSKHYSGYFPTSLNSTRAGMLHYWLTLSEGNPKTDPLVLWLQGGPGCSSLFGLFYENGQLHFTGDYDNSTHVPRLEQNSYAWTKSANMIWLEQPIGVGFSYCLPDATGDCSGNDFGLDAYNFFVNFFRAFPELAGNDFHISGESYGGVYVPYVADAIVTGNSQGANPVINLRGILVGNGLGGDADDTEQARREADFWYGHAAFSYQAHVAIEQTCDWNATEPSDACSGAIQSAESSIGSFYVYDIYDTCPHDLEETRPTNNAALEHKHARAQRGGRRRVRIRDLETAEPTALSRSAPLFAPLNAYSSPVLRDLGFVCVLESVSSDYLNTPAVQKSIHVTAANVSNWGPCGNGARDQNGRSRQLLAGHKRFLAAAGLMAPSDDPLGALYVKLIARMPVLIYSGDVDQCVPYYYSDNWTRRLGYPVDTLWQPWTYGTTDNQQVGGYVTQYTKQGRNLTFVTVRDSGHMVPQYQPEAALQLFQLYLAGRGYTS